MSTMTVAVAGYGWWGKQLVKSASLVQQAEGRPWSSIRSRRPISRDGAKQFGFKVESDFDKVLADKGDRRRRSWPRPTPSTCSQTLAAFKAGKACSAKSR